jgi:hypothetical protein
LGTSENAVKTQVWCAIATYVLIAIVKKELQLKSSMTYKLNQCNFRMKLVAIKINDPKLWFCVLNLSRDAG